jgi:phage terminase large subunit-like protein
LRKRDLEDVRQFTSIKYLGFLESAEDIYARGVTETLTYLSFPREHWRNSTARYASYTSGEVLPERRIRPDADLCQTPLRSLKGLGNKAGPEQEATLLT